MSQYEAREGQQRVELFCKILTPNNPHKSGGQPKLQLLSLLLISNLLIAR